MGFVPYSPLGRGFLTGQLHKDQVKSSVLANQPRYDQHFEENQTLVSVIESIAQQHGATAAQIALAWLWQQEERYGLPVAPIPGTRRVERVAENAAAVEIRLTAEQLAELEAISSSVQGDRNFTFTSADSISSGRE